MGITAIEAREALVAVGSEAADAPWVVADNGVVRAPRWPTPTRDREPALSPGPPADPGSAAQRIFEIRDLVEHLDQVPFSEMTGSFYQSMFDELDLAVRDLLHIIDWGLAGRIV